MWNSGVFGRRKREFYLENVVKTNKQFPRKFIIPTLEEMDKLDIGNLVKLIFVMERAQKDGCRAERMWVKIVNKHEESFTGILVNEPHYLKSVRFGDTITFKMENIACIYGGKLAFNENLFAIITNKALEKKEINWVVRTDDLNNEQDSGWQLFYGDESEQYLADSSNAEIISLEQVLSFEPLLESVFSSSGYSYEYSPKDNKYIEMQKWRQ